MSTQPVLVLNADYLPLNICGTRRAMVLLFKGKAEVLVSNHAVIRTVSGEYEAPSVIRLHTRVRLPPVRPPRPTRRAVFRRDRYTCQYCGTRTRELTIDHVVPRRLGGKHTWDNVVSACRRCNQKKGGRTPEAAGMRLLRPPRPPHLTPFARLRRRLPHPFPEEWGPFLNGVLSDLDEDEPVL